MLFLDLKIDDKVKIDETSVFTVKSLPIFNEETGSYWVEGFLKNQYGDVESTFWGNADTEVKLIE